MRFTSIKLSHLGYSFLEIWAFCILYGGTADTDGRSVVLGIHHSWHSFLWDFSSVVIVIATFAIVLQFCKADKPELHRSYTIAATVLNVVGTVLILLGSPEVGLCGLILASIGNAWLWISWGDVYALLDTESAEFTAIGSIMLQVVIAFIVIVSPFVVEVVTVLLATPIACLMYLSAIKAAGSSTGDLPPAPQASEKPYFGRLILGIGIPIALTYFLWGSAFSGSVLMGGIEITAVVGILVFATVFFAFIYFSPSISLFTICTVELCLIVAACLLASAGLDLSLGGSLVFAAMLVSQYLVLLYCGRLYREGFGNSVYTFGVGMLINHGFGWLGTFAVSFIAFYPGLTGAVPSSFSWCALCAISFFTIIFVRGNNAKRKTASNIDTTTESQSKENLLKEMAAKYNLSARETDVFLLLAKGRSAPFVRDELVISLNTVSSHVKHIYGKMGIHSRQELIDLADELYTGSAL